MGNLDKLRASSAWDSYKKLPSCPGTNNPHLYTALALRLLTFDELYDVAPDYYNYFLACEREEGLVCVSPGDQKVASHDELIGAAASSSLLAYRILKYLRNHDWFYEDSGNLARFLWFPAYIRIRSCNSNILDRLVWSAFILFDAFFGGKTDHGGRLRNWLMGKSIQDGFSICRGAYHFWARRMEKRGITLKECLRNEPKEHPILSELAPDSWL